jgi:hypothetical protein
LPSSRSSCPGLARRIMQRAHRAGTEKAPEISPGLYWPFATDQFWLSPMIGDSLS